MNRLIEILDVGDGGYMSRSEHLAYIAMPEEYIIVPQNKYERLMLTKDGDKLVSDRLRGISCGYIDYRYVSTKTVAMEITKIRKSIEKLNRDLSELETFQFNTD
jgi:hypothetical protein